METWFEIFRTGTHTDGSGSTRDWTEADLDAIATRYNGCEHEAPIVIGHPEGTAPAYGWVALLQRKGDKLLAAAKQIMPEFAELVNAGRYKKVSIGLTADNLLHHVAFLGAAVPAVTGLADATFTECPVELAVICTDENSSEEATEQNAMVMFAALEQRLALLESKLLESPAAAVTVQHHSTGEVAGMLSKAVTAGKVTPAQKEIALQMFALLSEPVTIDCFTAVSSLFGQFINLQNGHALFSEMPVPVTNTEHTPLSDFDRLRGLIQQNMHPIE